jgi:arginyl-tRNA synthetase
VDGAKADLALMGVHYDNWFSEQSLYTNGQYERIMTILREKGYLDFHDGAVWFKAQDLGGGKDEVIVRSDGSPGYFASDIAYHYGKFVERSFDRVIDVWGADHQGHAPRMKAMMLALGLDPARLTLILYQLVTLRRSGEIVRLSKRTGDIITLREVLEEVGSDAVRFFLLSRSADSQMDFDIDLAKEQSDENPVYYVQYAHARISSILRYAGELDYTNGDVSLLTSEPELALIRQMTRLPEVVRMAATMLSPHYLAYFAQDVATAFHSFYRDCRVVSSELGDEGITKARLKLVSACRIVLVRALHLMGMTAPETM